MSRFIQRSYVKNPLTRCVVCTRVNAVTGHRKRFRKLTGTQSVVVVSRCRRYCCCYCCCCCCCLSTMSASLLSWRTSSIVTVTAIVAPPWTPSTHSRQHDFSYVGENDFLLSACRLAMGVFSRNFFLSRSLHNTELDGYIKQFI